MTTREILQAYKQGQLTASDVRRMLQQTRSSVQKFPLSEGQRGLWMLQKLSPSMAAYNVPLCFRVKGALNISIFEKALLRLVSEHPLLNVAVVEEDGVPFCRISPRTGCQFEWKQIPGTSEANLLDLLREEAQRPFLLKEGPPVRASVYSWDADSHVLQIVVHHIVFDGRSVPILLQSLWRAYSDLLRGQSFPPICSSASYKDFVEYEQRYLAGAEAAKDRAFWLRQLAAPLPVLELLPDFAARDFRQFEGRAIVRRIDEETAVDIRLFCQQHQVTGAVLFLSMLHLLLLQYTRQDEFVVGVPMMGRAEPRFEDMIGYFVNMVPLRTRLRAGESFAALLDEVRIGLADAFDHSPYPFARMVRDLKLAPSEHSPVYQIAFEYQNARLLALADSSRVPGDLPRIELMEGIYQQGESDIGLEIVERSDGFDLRLKYNPSRYAAHTFERMLDHYHFLLRQVIDRPQCRLSDFPLLSASEADTILHRWNATELAYPGDRPVHELFSECARQRPGDPAVWFGERCLTYRELEEKSNKLASFLRSKGAGPGTRIGVCLMRSLDVHVAFLGVNKAGAASVPLAPDYPADRLRFQVQDSEVKLLLIHRELLPVLESAISNGVEAIVLDRDWPEIEESDSAIAPLDELDISKHPAYVIYTSGSTGKPKGVMVPNRGLTNVLWGLATGKPGMTSADRMLAVTTICFDVAQVDMYLPLITGAQCFFCSSEDVRNAERLIAEIRRIRPTVMQATPATWKMLFDAGWRNEEKVAIWTAGEAIPEMLRERFERFECTVWNIYGPTEASVYVTGERIDPRGPVTIGTPLPNCKAYVFDPDMQLLPPGIVGELCVGGDGLALGYLNRPELTAERFVDDPFRPGKQLYKTGDLARWLSDGRIDYVGRADAQIKLRGHRIELGEVEHRLLQHPDVQSCAVVVRERGENKELAAFLVLKHDGLPAEEKPKILPAKPWRQYLEPILPEVMIPAIYVAVEKIPNTPSRKIDRKALAAIDLSRIVPKSSRCAETNLGDVTEIQNKVLAIWKGLLQSPEIDVDEGFFDVGGDSVLAVTVAERIKTAFGVEFAVTDIFAHPSVRGIAQLVASRTAHEYRREYKQSQSECRVAPVVERHGMRYPDYYLRSIAIIGISCQFPGACDYRQFWSNLRNGVESIEILTAEQLRGMGVPDGIIADPRYIPARSTIADKALFDAEFFRIPPRDAELMDPQLRLLIENAWRAVEDAGYCAKDIPDTAVFMSASNNGYPWVAGGENKIPSYLGWVLAQNGSIPTIISHKLGLKGPSCFIHSNCSSSLVGIDAAYRLLLDGEAQCALVGGATVFSMPVLGYFSQQGMHFSADGHVRAFDAAASGMVSGEGAAAILVKPALAAIEDGDHIYALVRGASVNNDGADKAGYYAPSVHGQAEVITKALHKAGVDPASIGYLEAHGTGTQLGDPIEFAALQEAFAGAADGRSGEDIFAARQFCGLGSVKTNVGHLDTAAGLAGCIKAALSLLNAEIPPTLNFSRPNGNLDLPNSPFYIVDKLREWKTEGDPRRAGVSSFGIGGTNAHIVLEEFSAPRRVEEDADCLVPVSARNMEDLRRYVERLRAFLAEPSHLSEFASGAGFADLAFTLQVGREPMACRAAFLARDYGELIRGMSAFLDGDTTDSSAPKWKLSPVQSVNSCAPLDDARTLVGCIESRNLDKLASFWVHGCSIDWSQLHCGALRRRLSLPTYPFARKRYWLSEPTLGDGPQTSLTAGAASEGQHPPNLQEQAPKQEHTIAEEPDQILFFEEVWQEQPGPTTPALDLKKLLCFVPDGAWPERFLNIVKEVVPGASWILAQPGMRYERKSASDVVLDHAAAGDYRRLFDEVKIDWGELDGLLYLWPLHDRRFVTQFRPIVHLLQALGSSGINCSRIMLAGLFDGEGEKCYLDSWIGFERSLGTTGLQGKLAVAMQSDWREQSHGRLEHADHFVRRILAELRSPNMESVLYEGDRRFICRVHQRTGGDSNRVLRDRGTYVITGGAGHLGWLVARLLAKTYSAKLVLVGRTPVNDLIESRIAAMEKLGGEAVYVQGDVCALDQMQGVVNLAQQRFGTINGVFHIAGLTAGRGLLESTPEEFDQVTRPKIQGTMVLEEVLPARNLDFVCYFSSASAILGDFGSCDYAVANRFESAFVTAPPHEKRVAIGWPLWQEGGMKLGDEAGDLYLKTSGQKPLPTAAGLSALEELLARPGVRSAVFYGKRSRIERFFQRSTGTTDVPASASGPGRQPTMRGWPVQECVAWDLRWIAAELLKVEPSMLDFESNLGEFGFDSIGLADYAASLSTHYSIKITPGVFFSHPVLRRLAEYMVSEHGSIIAEFYREGEDQVITAPSQAIARSSPAHQVSPNVGCVRESASPSQGVAIVGMSGRFPEARSVEEMWGILEQGREAIGEIPLERFDWRPHYGMGEGRSQSKWMGLLPGVDEFDPLFFEISPREAEGMDPRQRLLLQEGWKALEEAGYGRGRLDGQRIGMFVGVEQGDYQFVAGGQIGGTGNHDAMMAARLAYCLNLRGPALVVNTACSSGLVALHQACLSIGAGECEAAVVGAANVLTTAQSYVAMTQSGLLSPEGKIYAFDRRANGLVPGEAVVALVVKPLERAEAAGDRIYAVIRGSGINYDGRTNGITAPSGEAQKELLRGVYSRCGVKAEEIEYVVAHGTGTRLGDPVEINALREVFQESGAAAGSCALTSNKANLGHTFAASGLVSVVNLVEAIRREAIPGMPNCEQANEYIEWEASPFYVNRELRSWKGRQGRRVGAVSSFGISGTNAHVVVENWRLEGLESGVSEAAGGWVLLAWSGKTEAAAKEQAAALEGVLKARCWNWAELRAMSRTLLAGRQHFSHRFAMVIKDGEQAGELFACAGRGESRPNLQAGQVARGFTGQKALQQYAEELLDKAGQRAGAGDQSRESLQALAELHCQGYNPDWERLFPHHRPRVISLPTYPFARERYWAGSEGAVKAPEMLGPVLHPLVHRNVSTLWEQRFTSTFTGQEPFFQAAAGSGERLFTQIFLLEMARATITLASTGSAIANGDFAQIRLQGLEWPRQFALGTTPSSLEITIAPCDDCLDFRICPSDSTASEAQTSGGDSSHRYCQGSALPGIAWSASLVDFKFFKSVADARLTATDFYDRLRGIVGAEDKYSRIVEEAFCGVDRHGCRFIAAKFELPAAATDDSFGLPVRFLQAIWQACLCLCSLRSAAGEAKIAALSAMEARFPLPHNLLAIVIESQAGNTSSEFDIDVCDTEGTICFRAEGLCLEPIATETPEQDAYQFLLPSESEAGDRDGDVLWICTQKRPAILSSVIALLPPCPFEVCSTPEIAAAAQSLEMSMICLLGAALRRCGLPVGKSLYSEDWRRAGLTPQYDRWLEHSLRVLEQCALLTSENGGTILRESSQTEWEESWRAWENSRQSWLAYPELSAQALLVEASLRNLPEILTGKIAATEILFGGAGMEQIVGTYKENPISDFYNDVLADCVAMYCTQCRQAGSEKLRIIEIGAGTGGTSAALFEKLAPLQSQIEEYCFSDISQAFLIRAEQTYGPSVPYLSYKRFDVEKPLVSQSLLAGSFDVVVASSVLHATRDIRATVRNAKAALKRNGVLILNEIVGQSLFAHLTFGLLEGWWRFGDPELRVAGCPALLPESWNQVLTAEGFRSVAFPAQRAHAYGQQIVVAESDGRILQPAKAARNLRLTSSIDTALFQCASGKSGVSCGRGSAFSGDSERLAEMTQAALVNIVAAQMKLRIESVDIDAGLGEFGYDSIAMTVFSKKLNESFDLDLAPAIFFEYASVRSLVRYLVEQYPSKLVEKLKPVTGFSEAIENIEASEKACVPMARATRTTNCLFGKKAVPFSNRQDDSPIAVVGMSGRFPMADDLSAFWTNLGHGRDCISEIPADRWDWRAMPGDLAAFRWGGFIDSVAEFDPLFFGISPRDAELMDPQQRLMMMYVWKVIEDAGYSAQSLSGSNTAVIVATAGSGYDALYAHAAAPVESFNFTGVMSSIGPNRASYFLNLHGPSEPVETTCSSSLVAIHRGIQAIRNDQCEMAIVGGVNTIIAPTAHFSVARAGMLSPQGRCKTFSSHADGYVRGEGVGMLMLKRLSQAEKDGDNIHAVILSSAENHGGRANSLTAPNSQAQAEVIKKAYTRAAIDPRTVGYIEAHGTGTALGDPVEINALKSAFNDLYLSTGQTPVRSRHCGLGAVKTNIGHLELAAGVAGVIKVILQLQHRKLAKSLHCDELNPYIQLEESPFYLVRETVPWPALKDARGREMPRRAGVSSFGAGGVNVHIVLQEYTRFHADVPQLRNPAMPALILLSAKNEERLSEQAKQMVSHLSDRTTTAHDLQRLAFTLQAGREAMDKRLALACNSGAELKEMLERFLAGNRAIPNVYTGDAKVEWQTIAALESDEDFSTLMDGWIAKGKFERILDLWSKGLKIDWARFYGEVTPRRVSLPTYPFARERYWITTKTSQIGGDAVHASDPIHPLLHRNTSTLAGQRYTSCFTGREPAFVNSPGACSPILPALALLEVACAAMFDAFGVGKSEDEHRAVHMRKVEFPKPAYVAGELCIHVALVSLEPNGAAFEIYSELEESESERIVYCKGEAVLDHATIDKVDMAALRAIPASRAAVASLSDSAPEQDRSGCFLGSGLTVSLSTAGNSAGVPCDFSMVVEGLDESLLVRPVPVDATAVFFQEDADGAAPSMGVYLCDRDGNLCARFRGMRWASPESPLPRVADLCSDSRESVASTSLDATEVQEFEETWEECELTTGAAIHAGPVVCFLSGTENQRIFESTIREIASQQAVIFVAHGAQYERISSTRFSISRDRAEDFRTLLSSIVQEHGSIGGLFYLWPVDDRDCIADYRALLYLVQATVAAQLRCPRLLLAGRFQNALERCYLDSWIGFEKSLEKVVGEPTLAVIIEGHDASGDASADADAENVDAANWARRLWAELCSPLPESAWYQGKKRHVRRIRPLALEEKSTQLRSGGVYLITGGTGGLGRIFAEHLSGELNAKVVVTSRSPQPNPEGNHPNLLYLQADVCNPDQMQEALRKAVERFGPINGVIHGAGVDGSGGILTKSLEDFEAVLAPKVKGTLALEEALKEHGTDFICYFSSSSAVLGDFGSCDYAVANRFMSAYAQHCGEGLSSIQRVAIAWPLWRQGAMGIRDSDGRDLYLKASGLRSLEAQEGLKIFEHLLANRGIQGNQSVLVMAGVPSKIARALGLNSEQPAVASRSEQSSQPVRGRLPAMEGWNLEQCALWDVTRIASSVVKIPPEKLIAQENLAEFGLDSLGLADFAKVLGRHYEIVFSPSIFFSHPTLEKVASYIVSQYPSMLEKFYPTQTSHAADMEKENVKFSRSSGHPVYLGRTRSRPRQSRIRESHARALSPSQGVAIVGMSGRFPEARSVEEMWGILEQGREAIGEIPLERFDWRPHYGMGEGRSQSKWMGLLPGVDEFDPLFFEISPREAEGMDPRQRLLLQEGWKALEEAGYGRGRLDGQRIGMFVGVEQGDYQFVAGGQIGGTGNHDAMMAARLAYCLNLRGPALVVNTACSSGLVALHQACLSIGAGECEAAVVGAANVLTTAQSYVAMTQSGLLSPEGKIYAFDRRANGLVPGEAVVALVVKPLERAEAAGDRIYAVIRGSGINYDGRTNGITAPSGEAQKELLRGVYSRCGVKAEEIEYVVAHGTGTRLGDPVEINALREVFQESGAAAGSCALTSNKANLGHTFAASGLVSVVNLVEAIRREAIPGMPNCEQANEYIEWEASPFYVNRELRSWKGRQGRRVGAVSSFGISGTNAHVVVENWRLEGLESGVSEAAGGWVLLAWSGKTEAAAKEQAAALEGVLKARCWNWAELRAMSRTLLAGRQHFSHRFAMVIKDGEQAGELFACAGRGESRPNLQAGQVARGFTGQKALQQYAEELLDKAGQRAGAGDQSRESLQALAELHCQGYNPDWERLFPHHRPRVISLPTYPFARERYWYSEQKTVSIGSSLPDRGTTTARKQLFLKKGWQVAPVAGQASALPNRAVILGSSSSRELAERLASRFRDPQILDIEHLQGVNLGGQVQSSEAWIDLIGCCDSRNKGLDWMPLLQQQIKACSHRGLTVLGVTRGLESFENSRVNLAGALAAGLYRMLQSEYSSVHSRHLDLDPCTGPDSAVEQILAEISNRNDDAEICYRGGARYRALLREVDLPASSEEKLRFVPEHVLLVTGGTRGLGSLSALHMVREHGVRRVVLIGREGLPPREQWDATRSSQDPTAHKVANVEALEAAGADVTVLGIPLADSEKLRNSLASIRNSHGPIGGVIHCAGTAEEDSPAFVEKQVYCAEKVLAPKVEGLNTLLECLRGEPLEFFVLFSSVSAVVPRLATGQSVYAMANAYMDYAAQAFAADYPMLSMQWPSWKDSGMGPARTPRYFETGLLTLADAEGLELLDRALVTRSGPVLLPAVVDPALWSPESLLQRASSVNRPLQGRQVRNTDEAMQSSLLSRTRLWLRDLILERLKLEPAKFDQQTPLQEYGVDSIMLVQFLQPVQALLDESLDPSLIYQYPSIAAFSEWLANNHGTKLSSRLPPGSSPLSGPLETVASDLVGSSRHRAADMPDAAKARLTFDSPIAVVGLACRFPGAENVDEYWNLLSKGRISISKVPGDRFGYPIEQYAGLLDNISRFDPAYFGIPELDARLMDPQALMVLEEALKVIHHAGYVPHDLKGERVGVYLGARSQHRPDESLLSSAQVPVRITGPNYMAANVSQFFDLRGVSVVVDTACSSALVAMNMAIQDLRSGDLLAAVVGGVNLLQTDAPFRLFAGRGILNGARRFHVYDGRADGIVPAEGIGMVLLKTLEQARADGDRIYAVVRSIAVNNDGRTAGPTAPNFQTQKDVMAAALAKSGLRPEQISYIEVNGSGAVVNDLLELKAIESVYRADGKASLPCELGSMKPNIGHPLTAEGIASFIKVTLMLYHGRRVPFLSAEESMEHYDFSRSPFCFSRALNSWDGARIAALNCFADGGTNAHIILEGSDSLPNAEGRSPVDPPLLRPIDLGREAGADPITVDSGLGSPWDELPDVADALSVTADEIVWESVDPSVPNHAPVSPTLN